MTGSSWLGTTVAGAGVLVLLVDTLAASGRATPLAFGLLLFGLVLTLASRPEQK